MCREVPEAVASGGSFWRWEAPGVFSAHVFPSPFPALRRAGCGARGEPCHFLLVVLHLVMWAFPLRCSLSRKSFQRLSEVWDEDGNVSVPSAQGRCQCGHPSDQVPGRPGWPWLCTWSFLETPPSVHLPCPAPCGRADTLGPCSLNPPEAARAQVAPWAAPGAGMGTVRCSLLWVFLFSQVSAKSCMTLSALGFEDFP